MLNMKSSQQPQLWTIPNAAIFWDIPPLSLHVNRSFRGNYHLHPQGRKSTKQETSVQQVPGNKPAKAVVMLRPTISRPVCLVVGHPSGTHNQIFITVGHLQVSLCVATSLTRGWVCNLLVQLLAGLGSAVTNVSKYRRTVSFETPPNLRTWRARPHISFSGKRVAQLYPRALSSLLRPLRLDGLRWRYRILQK
jgi:hypothetical protein